MKKLYVVGFGPGNQEYMCGRALEAFEEADCIVGYTTYVQLVRACFPEKEFVETPMRTEVKRCRMAIEEAQKGRCVALISSGDAGIYGMAGAVYETAHQMEADVEIEVVPGITAASAAAAVLGAPLMNDFCVVSLSDLMTPAGLIDRRIRLAAEGDFVLCLYNPRSRTRTERFDRAMELLRKNRAGDTPVGIVKNAGRAGEMARLVTLAALDAREVDMSSIVLVGNSGTYVKDGKMITPRGYFGEGRQEVRG